MYAYNGNNSSESLGLLNWDNNWNTFYMYAGDDKVNTPNTGIDYTFWGGNGNDYFMGDTGKDTAHGGYDSDILKGWSGADYLYGEWGDDRLYGGSGKDTLVGDGGSDDLYGGTGSDLLYGGNTGGSDVFHFRMGESPSETGSCDLIFDWNPRYDDIESSITGTKDNYREHSTIATSMGQARYVVEHDSKLKEMDHVFLYNSDEGRGWLLSDLNHDYKFETGVVLYGASNASWMSYSDII